MDFVGKIMSLLFNMLSRLLMPFLPRSTSFKFMAAVTIYSDFGAAKNKVINPQEAPSFVLQGEKERVKSKSCPHDTQSFCV